MKSLSDVLRELLTPGTPACGLLGGIAGVIIAALLLSIGFWKTLFVAAMFLAGAFVCGVKDKGEFIKNLVNKLLPDKE